MLFSLIPTRGPDLVNFFPALSLSAGGAFAKEECAAGAFPLVARDPCFWGGSLPLSGEKGSDLLLFGLSGLVSSARLT
jgi:hypothetical protein